MVNDGSTDATSQILAELSEEILSLLVNCKKYGVWVGNAEGLNVASKKFAAYVPGDGQFQSPTCAIVLNY